MPLVLNLSTGLPQLAWLLLLLLLASAATARAMAVYGGETAAGTAQLTGPSDDDDAIVVRDRLSAAALINRLLGKEALDSSPLQTYYRSLQKRAPLQPLTAEKRHDGLWIWMPAQGYVSVPKDQEISENDSTAKHGKIMRYGRRRRRDVAAVAEVQ